MLPDITATVARHTQAARIPRVDIDPPDRAVVDMTIIDCPAFDLDA
jgi:hypothetical protein